eukprot:4138870-Prymnesium_polylepis.2
MAWRCGGRCSPAQASRPGPSAQSSVRSAPRSMQQARAVSPASLSPGLPRSFLVFGSPDPPTLSALSSLSPRPRSFLQALGAAKHLPFGYRRTDDERCRCQLSCRLWRRGTGNLAASGGEAQVMCATHPACASDPIASVHAAIPAGVLREEEGHRERLHRVVEPRHAAMRQERD